MELTQNIDNKTIDLQEVDFDPFAGPKLVKVIPTTQSQLEIWLSCIMGGDDANRSYNESISLKLKGDLNTQAIKSAINTLQDRHEILRSTFSPDGKSICIYKPFPVSHTYRDLSEENPENQQKELDKLHKIDAESVFDLVRGPLLRTYLIKTTEQEHILKISAHHLVCDGWSFGIILENLSAIYNSLVGNKKITLETPIPYSHYAQEIQEHTSSNEYREIEAFWLNQYNDVPILNLPTDRVRPQVRTFKSHRADFSVSKNIIESLKNLGLQKKASLITTLISAFESYLYLLTKQNDIVLGLPASGQSATGNYELVGHCVNLLPLRSKITGSERFLDYLEKRKSEILDAYDHQQFTFSSLLQKLNIARDSSRVPLVPVIFNVDMGMDANVSFSGLEHELFSDPRAYENFEIFLNITGTEQKLNFEWSYNSLLFTSDTIERMMGEFQSLLECLIAEPSIKIKDIHISRNRSLLKDLDQWNNTVITYPKNKTVADLINETAIKYPSKAAIIFNDQEVSYTQLNQQSNQIAHYLINQGVKENDIIALVADRSPEMIIVLLGIIKSGAAYLPLDPQYPEGRIKFMLEDSGAKYALVSQTQQATLHTSTTMLIIEDLLLNLQDTSSSYPSLNLTTDRTAYLLYTSGSTGKPKGVQIKHPSLTNFLLSVQKEPGIKENDVLLAVSTISFDIAATEIFLPLISGASVYLADTHSTRDGRSLLDIVQNKGISIMQATPLTWRMMLAAGWNQKLPLKVICTGEAFPKDLAETLLLKSSEVWNGYGPTEATIWASIKKLNASDELITIGNPIANTQLYILDEHLSPVPLGTSGELYIAGDCLADGYLNRPDLSDQKFLPNPFKPGTKIYQTGDLGYRLPNGEVVCLGRADAQVKIRGHRIELGEIEYNLSQQAGIKEAVVIAEGDDKDNQQLLAYVVPDEKDSSGWMERWDDLYTLGIKSEESVPLEDQNLDIAIISQYNNQEDIKEHGREWTQEGLKRIRALKAKKILELGTGGGHLLFELAPNVEKYIATDYSDVAISKLNDKLALNKERWKHVNAFRAPADDFSSIQEKDFDLIFFHGVVQYFPTLEYLVKVLETAVDHLRDGGCIHIGDSQTLSAISMHFATEQLALLQDQVTVDEFEKIVRYQTEKEEEISIDPGFFYFLPQLIPNITAVDVQIRGGDYSNEATKCHYDIWLYKGESVPRTVANDIVETWHERSSLESIDTLLSDHSNKVILIRDIPNQRVVKDYALSQIVRTLDKNDTVKTIKGKLRAINPTGINPTELWRLGEQRGFKTHIRWANDASDGNIEVVFIPFRFGECLPDAPSQLVITSEKEYLRIKKDTVEILNIPDHQIHLWRNTLKAYLPEFMIPNALIALNRFPTTENGKIDRKSLPQPAKISTETQSSQAKPGNATEQLIHDLWCKHLDLTSVDIHSNFFELGGHSLIAVRLMLDLEKETGIRLPISALFQNSSIGKLAEYVDNKNHLQNESLPNDLSKSLKGTDSPTKTVPAIEPQKEIWVACMLGEDDASKSYNISFSYRFSGSLDRTAMEKALQTLVDRHESLRATFNEDGTGMIIRDYQEVAYIYQDISDLTPEDRNIFIENLIVANSDTVLDLSKGPLFKANLIKEKEDQHFLAVTFHHIICDGFSSSLIMNELTVLYDSYVQGNTANLPSAESFADYALSKQEFYQSPHYDEVQRFWADQFKSEVPVLDIPTDSSRSIKRSYNGSREFYKIQPSLADKFRKIGFKSGCSSAISLRAVLEIFLHRVSGQETIVSGLPTAGQLSAKNPTLVGHCVNLLPIKADINIESSFLDYLHSRRDYLLNAYDFSELTFSSLVNKLNVTRDPSRIPLTPVVLNIQSEPYGLQFHNLTVEPIAQKKLYETFEIAINVDDLDSGMFFRWDYNADLYNSRTIRYFHQLFEHIMKQVCDNPAILIKDVELYPLPSKSLANDIQPVNQSIYDLLKSSFNKFSSATAIRFNKESITYKTLNERTNQLAHLLLEKGVQEGDKVAIAMDRSIEMIISVLAIVKAGAVYVPIDITFPKERIERILRNVQPKCVIKSDDCLNFSRSDIPMFDINDCMRVCQSRSKKNLDMQYDEYNLIFILHTSGSTGQPKGVCMGQKAMTNLLLWQAQNSTAIQGTKTLQFSPITFDVSFQEIFSTLTTGGTLELITNEERLDGLALLDQIIAKKVERIFLPFVALQALAENAVDTNTFPLELKEVMTAGEQLKITPQLIKFFSKIPSAKLFNQYGPTEAHVVSQFTLTGEPTNWPTLPSIGRPINNTNIVILDTQLKEVYPGTAGELCIIGTCLSSGYLNMPEATNGKFIIWQVGDHYHRIYRTGDLARYLPDGNIEYLGRIDSQVKIRGYRVELGEIEAELTRIPEITQAAVKVQEDQIGNKRLVAYYTLNNIHDYANDNDAKIKEWRFTLKNNLPEYMMPHEFVRLGQMPKTPSGKINRLALPSITEFSNTNKMKEIKSPQNSNESFLLKVWKKTLGINNISTDDNFFELGGHSILAVKVILAIEKEKGTRLPLAILFERPTIEKLASVIDGNPEKVRWNSLVTIKSTGSKTPIYLVHGGGLNVLTFEPLAKYMDKNQPIYALQALGLDGRKEKLLYTMEDLAQHYISEILESNPTGPYILGGYSFGGLLAYEMARQLIAMGKKIEFIAILDTYCGGRDKREDKGNRILRKITRQFIKFGFITRSFLHNPFETVRYQWVFIQNKIKNIFSHNYVVNDEFFTYDAEINRSYDIAYENYKMSPMDVEVHLFKTQKRLYFLDDGKYYGWKKYALKGVRVYEVPGDHKTFLLSPNNKKFSRILQTAINTQYARVNA
ncbi:non-ribosomal peptide synthetase [Albibacterium indicum]|uniref:non-ribosomal peptide synthetase n=1 Tax=Albibacterium indicum TaxID=2292082 RepID=UPI0013EEFC48|nr:non-ribosomal peptide synthetase [Pedobacter indicus]